MRRRILGFVHKNAFNALYGAAWMYAEKFRRRGFPTDIVDLSEEGAITRLERELNPSDIAFCYAPQGIGSRLGRDGVTFWQDKKVPFLGLHGDNPCYNIFNHTSGSRFVSNLYLYPSFAEIHRRYIQGPQIIGSIPFQTDHPGDPPVRFRDRAIKILYLKSFESIKECTSTLNSLPGPLRDGMWAQIERAERSPNYLVGDLVAEIFTQLGISRGEQFDLFWGCAHWVDMYLRRKRAHVFVDWLKRQDGAVIIGSGWDKIDQAEIRAVFKPSVDIRQMASLIQQSQIVCSTNPYGEDIIHERAAFGLMNRSLVISDANAWWDRHFREVPAWARFDWDGSLDDQLRPVLDLSSNEMEQRAETGFSPAFHHFTGYDIAGLIFDHVRKITPDFVD